MTPGKRKSNSIRRLIRQEGWTVIKVRADSEHPDPFTWSYNKTNTLNYHEMVEWCRQTYSEGTWVSSLYSYTGNNEPGTRRFVFQRQQDASYFALKWL